MKTKLLKIDLIGFREHKMKFADIIEAMEEIKQEKNFDHVDYVGFIYDIESDNGRIFCEAI